MTEQPSSHTERTDLQQDPRILVNVTGVSPPLWVCSVCSVVFLDPDHHFRALHPTWRPPRPEDPRTTLIRPQRP